MADASTTPEVPFRILPRLTDLNRDFWTGGQDGELRAGGEQFGHQRRRGQQVLEVIQQQ